GRKARGSSSPASWGNCSRTSNRNTCPARTSNRNTYPSGQGRTRAMNAQHSGRPNGPERRAEPRRPTELKGDCCPVGGLLTERRQVRLRNVSQRGVALASDRPWSPGTLLNLELPLDERLRVTQARVVHATAQPGGSYLIGCVIDSGLSEEQVT